MIIIWSGVSTALCWSDQLYMSHYSTWLWARSKLILNSQLKHFKFWELSVSFILCLVSNGNKLRVGTFQKFLNCFITFHEEWGHKGMSELHTRLSWDVTLFEPHLPLYSMSCSRRVWIQSIFGIWVGDKINSFNRLIPFIFCLFLLVLATKCLWILALALCVY